jgi:thiol:disulfide interchange protein
VIRRLLVAAAAVVVAGTVFPLALAAAADAWLSSSVPVLLGLAAVFVVQPLYVLARHNRRERRP